MDNAAGEKEELSNECSSLKKSPTPGVIYISFLPPNMTPLHLRQIFEKYGEVGRIYLQPEEKKTLKKKKHRPRYNKGTFTEGWIEIGDKNLAKKIVLTFHNTLIEDGKKAKFSDYTWNLKYLHRFRWRHLTERLAHEREVRKQKMRIEHSQARKETAAFIANMDAGKRFASIKQRHEKQGRDWVEKRTPKRFKQRKTVEQLLNEKRKKLNALHEPLNSQSSESNVNNTDAFENTDQRKTVLSKIFGS